MNNKKAQNKKTSIMNASSTVINMGEVLTNLEQAQTQINKSPPDGKKLDPKFSQKLDKLKRLITKRNKTINVDSKYKVDSIDGGLKLGSESNDSNYFSSFSDSQQKKAHCSSSSEEVEPAIVFDDGQEVLAKNCMVSLSNNSDNGSEKSQDQSPNKNLLDS